VPPLPGVSVAPAAPPVLAVPALPPLPPVSPPLPALPPEALLPPAPPLSGVEDNDKHETTAPSDTAKDTVTIERSLFIATSPRCIGLHADPGEDEKRCFEAAFLKTVYLLLQSESGKRSVTHRKKNLRGICCGLSEIKRESTIRVLRQIPLQARV
jgi:hypothetical protein